MKIYLLCSWCTDCFVVGTQDKLGGNKAVRDLRPAFDVGFACCDRAWASGSSAWDCMPVVMQSVQSLLPVTVCRVIAGCQR